MCCFALQIKAEITFKYKKFKEDYSGYKQFSNK